MISLALPPLLNELLAAGRWPRTPAEALPQNLAPLVAVARIQALALEESDLYLEPIRGSGETGATLPR